MKNLLFFIVGMVYLPLWMVIKIITYIKDSGKGVIEDYKFWKKFENNLKKFES